MAQTTIPYVKNSNGTELARTFIKYDDPADFDWQPNIPFDAVIEILSISGSIASVMDVSTKIRYWILTSYLMELIKLDLIRNAQVNGTWIVYKHGQAYGIKLV